MVKDILIESDAGQTRLALIEDGDLYEYYVERKGHEKLVGNIYMGRVMNVLPGIQAAFVDIGLEKNGFLYIGELQVSSKEFGESADEIKKQLSSVSIRKMLKNGQEILTQVVKEPGGTKGPRLTSNVTLPGRMAVLLPTVDYIGVSRRIENEEERLRLRALAEAVKPEGMGVIVRTAAENATEEDLSRDIQYLHKLWQSIKARSTSSTAPALLYREVSLIHRAVRDMLTSDVNSLKIDNEEMYLAARSNAEMLSAEMLDKVEFYQRETPLFDLFRVDSKAEKALLSRVWLKSGGYLVFDYAEALTVIDVNTGKFVGKTSLADTILQINCEAAIEIAKQLRLRDIGGIVIIDFIDMDAQEHRDQLLSVLRAELKKDRTKTNLVGITGLGLVEMTRKKVHQPIHTLLKQTCPVCQGSGLILSDETVARNALHELKARATREESSAYLVETTAGVAGQLMLLGCPVGIRAYVHASDKHRFGEYEILPASEHELPPKTRAIPKEN